MLVRTLACGICGSDLHAVHHLDHVVDMAKRSGLPFSISADHDVVLGHEFCAEILDFGPGCRKALRPGARVVAMPRLVGAGGIELVGFSNRFPGGFGELMVLQESLLLEVPADLPTEIATTTEPFAVGAHAVARAGMGPGMVAMVVGCGPVGLAVISALKARGFGPVIATDFSPARREVAELIGADIVIDPAVSAPEAQWSGLDVPATIAERATQTMLGRQGKRAVIFECVGAPGILQSLIEGAPPSSRIVVVGVCMQEDRFEPAMAVNKELSLEFAFGYTPDEFSGALLDLVERRIDAKPMLSGTVGLDGVADAFDRLIRDKDLIKVLVTP